MLKVHDADMKECVFGPIYVNAPEIPEDIASVQDCWIFDDNEALKYLVPDMSCDALAALIHIGEKSKHET